MHTRSHTCTARTFLAQKLSLTHGIGSGSGSFCPAGASPSCFRTQTAKKRSPMARESTISVQMPSSDPATEQYSRGLDHLPRRCACLFQLFVLREGTASSTTSACCLQCCRLETRQNTRAKQVPCDCRSETLPRAISLVCQRRVEARSSSKQRGAMLYDSSHTARSAQNSGRERRPRVLLTWSHLKDSERRQGRRTPCSV